MIRSTSPRERPRNPTPGPPPERLVLHLPRRKPPAGRDFLIALGAIAATGLVFFTGGKLAGSLPGIEEQVQIVETAPPPPPKEIKEPPKPVPPPVEKTPPPPAREPPPPPQFGLEKEAVSENGDVSAATGNTLMKKSDSIVRPAPPPQPPEPTRLDQEPLALDKVMPKYPEWALDQGVTSRVLVMVTIGADGKVVEAQVQKTGGKDFDQASLQAAKATHYSPYVEKGRPLPARFVVTYEFVLQ
jgi:protein TonB